MGSRKKKKKKKSRRKGGRPIPSGPVRTPDEAGATTEAVSAEPAAATHSPQEQSDDAVAPTPPSPAADGEVELQPFGQGPRFSVLMAAYNRADLIHVAIDSVLVQDFDDYELVIVDDGSTDGTPEVVRGYSDPRIRYIQKPKNEGRAPTRRRAVAEAKGEFVLWMADDDLLAPGLLTLYDRVLHENPRVDVVYGNLQLFDHDTGKDLNLFEPNDWTGRDEALLGGKLYGSCIPDGGTATRREVYARVEGGLYDDEFVRAQDYELWTRIVGKARFHKIDQTVYRYRKHEGGTSWGQFIDLSYESKIIRAHGARHSLEALFPKFDWLNRAGAESVALFHIGRNLRRYEDPFNAARILEACESVYSETEMATCLFWAKLASGDLAGAGTVVERFGAQQFRPHREVARLGEILRAAEMLRTEGRAALARRDAPGLDQCAVAFLGKHELTYDVCLFRAQAHELIGDRENALGHYCKAARLNPHETEAYARAKSLAVDLDLVGPKTDVDAMRRRLREQFLTLPTPPTPLREGPKVSVIAHNDGSADARLGLESVLAQDYSPLELIVVGEEPPGGDPRIRWVSEAQGSMGALYNAGWTAATGSLVIYLPAGAGFYRDHVGRIVGLLGAEAQVVFTLGHYLELAEGQVVRGIRSPLSAFHRTQLLAAQVYPLASVAMRRTVNESPPFDEAIAHSEWDFLLRLSSEHPPVDGAHLGYGIPMVVDPVFEGRPDPDYLRGIQEIYHRHERDALFDMTARELQAKRLQRLGVGQPVQGRTSIVVLVSQTGPALEQFLEHVRAQTWVPMELVLVAHQLDHDTKEWLRDLEEGEDDLSVCVYGGLLSPAKAINLGIARANGEVVAILRDDVRLGHGWLGRLQHHLLADPKMGLVMAAATQEPFSAADELVSAHWGQMDPTTRLDDRCLVFTRTVLEKIGGVDVALGADGFEWDDFMLRLGLAGYTPHTARDVYVSGAVRHPPLGDQYAGRFARRWGGPPQDGALPVPTVSFDKALHFAPFGSESGYRPDARPVVVEEAAARNLLVFPPWQDKDALTALLFQLGRADVETATWLRAPSGEGAAHARLLGTALESAGPPNSDPTLLVVDAPLAPERESGLYLAADAIYVDEEWPGMEVVIRRTIDCGRPLLRGPDALDHWLASPH